LPASSLLLFLYIKSRLLLVSLLLCRAVSADI